MLNNRQKVGLSLLTIIYLGIILYFGLIPPEKQWVYKGMTGYYILTSIAQTALYIQSTILLVLVWKNKSIERKTKIEWTWACLIVGWIANNIFIWNKSDQYK